VNSRAQKLYLYEADCIKNDNVLQTRVLKSYKMMLNFYGFELIDENTGQLQKHQDAKNRLDNIASNRHNFLRITRILKSLGELGLEHLKKEFLSALLKEVYITKTLKCAKSALGQYWIPTLKDDIERENLIEQIDEIIEQESQEKEAHHIVEKSNIIKTPDSHYDSSLDSDVEPPPKFIKDESAIDHSQAQRQPEEADEKSKVEILLEDSQPFQ
jgi:hypothetical protein